MNLDLPLDVEDAIQAAYAGLVEAAQRFDFTKHDPAISDLDTNFKSFAYLRIRGSVIDESRKMSFVRRRGLEKGMRVYMDSIDEMRDGAESGLMPAVQVAALEEDADLIIDFETALDTLTDRERRVVLALAVGGRGKELAEEFDITESRVSQIAKEARDKLLERMAS